MTLGSLKFVYHVDGDGANLVDSMDMLNFASGFELAEGGWIQQVPAGDNVTLVETLTFRVRAFSQDDLAARLQRLDEWITRINYYKSQAMRTAVWLRVTVAGETNPRQAMITAMQYAISESAFGTLWADSIFIGDLTIVLERSAWWEDGTPVTRSITGLNYQAVPEVLSTEIVGDVPARVYNSILREIGSTHEQNSVWIGFKDDRYFNPVNFTPVRPLYAADTSVGADSTFINDATAVVTKALQVTFATVPTLAQRHNLQMNMLASFTPPATINTSTLTNDYTSGEYIVLMRARITSTAVVRARIKLGYKNAPTADRIYPRVTIVSTLYRLYEMGNVIIPPQRISGAPGLKAILSTALKLDAELVSGSGYLVVDSYTLIPLDSAIKLYTDEGYLSISGGRTTELDSETNPVNEIFSYVVDPADIVYDTAQVSPFTWGVPRSINGLPPALIIATNGDATGAELVSEYAMFISYLRRWRTLRGNE